MNLPIPTDYSKAPHENYRCEQCGSHGVRLYRDYNTFADHSRLLCTKCTEESQNCKAEGHAHQIGWMVAAVPTERGDSLWGYTSVPHAGVDWWDALPVELALNH